MIIDCRTWNRLPDKGASQQRRVFVDGKQIDEVWYVDTDAGLVHTYVVDTSRRAIATPGMFPADCWDSGGVLTRTICGSVELKPLDLDAA